MEDLVSQVSLKGCPVSLLSEWAGHARQSKRLHEDAASHFAGQSDTGLITAVVLEPAGGLINILLGAVSAGYGGGAIMNGCQVVMACASVASATIMSGSKQLGWDSRANTHAKNAGHYSELARLITSERALARLNDSTLVSVGELMKKVQAELDRIKDGAPPITEFIEKKLGMRVPPSPARSPDTSEV